jgi:hypothetical protein
MKQTHLTLIGIDAVAIRNKVMETKRVVSSQRPALVAETIDIAERMLERLRAL